MPMDPDLRGSKASKCSDTCVHVCGGGKVGSGEGLMGDITQTDVQLPHPVQMYVYDPCNLDPLPLGSR